MNRKAQGIPVLGVLFSLLTFLILWMSFFAGWLQDWANRGIELNHLTGLEAFFLAYINVWVFCGIILAALVTIYLGDQQ